MKIIPMFVLSLFVGATPLLAQHPQTWESRGIGGGGAMFAVSISPTDPAGFFASTDMSELYYSGNGGRNYEVMSFRTVNGNHNSVVRFTKVAGLLYVTNYRLNGNLDNVVPCKSTDGGRTWQALPGVVDPTEETISLYVDYNNPSHVMMSTYGTVLWSSDGGTTFNPIHQAKDNGSGVVVGGALLAGDTVLIGTNDGLIVSTNGGATFSEVAPPGIAANEMIWSFAAGKVNGKITAVCITAISDVYVGHPPWEYKGLASNVYTMSGWGSAFVRRDAFTAATENPMYVAMPENNATAMYIGGNSSSAPMVKKSTDRGATWTNVFNAQNNANITTGWSGDGGDRGWSYGETVFTLAVSPTDANVVMFGDYGFLHRTTDGGETWNQAYTSPTVPHIAGSPTPRREYYSSIGLENTSCWSLCFAPPKSIIGCYTDIRATISTDDGNTWGFDFTGHAANTMYKCERSVTGTLYAATSNVHDLYQSTRLTDATLDANDPQGKVISSTDGGHTWTNVHTFGHPVFWIALDPSTPTRAYASVVHSTLGGIYVTNDLDKGAASNWTRLASPPRTEGHPACIVVLKNGNVVCTYSGRRISAAPTFTTSSGCFVYNTTTSTWTDVSAENMKWWTKDVVIDPTDASQRTWYVGVFSGWGGPANNKGGLYRTTNAGQSWSKIMEADRITSCTFDPLNTKHLYVTSEVEGLWYTDDVTQAMPTFIRDEAFPFRQPERVFFHPTDSSAVWVTTAGNGLRFGRRSVGTTDVAEDGTSSVANINIVPQPATDWCEITGNDMGLENCSFVLRDAQGRVLFVSQDRRIDLRSCSSGVFVVDVFRGVTRVATKRIYVVR